MNDAETITYKMDEGEDSLTPPSTPPPPHPPIISEEEDPIPILEGMETCHPPGSDGGHQ